MTVVRPAPAVVEDFVIVRQTQDGTVAVQRPQGSSGDEDGPTDPDAIQAALESRSSGKLFGWKIAATSEAGQRHINVDGPMAGRILPETVIGTVT